MYKYTGKWNEATVVPERNCRNVLGIDQICSCLSHHVLIKNLHKLICLAGNDAQYTLVYQSGSTCADPIVPIASHDVPQKNQKKRKRKGRKEEREYSWRPQAVPFSTSSTASLAAFTDTPETCQQIEDHVIPLRARLAAPNYFVDYRQVELVLAATVGNGGSPVGAQDLGRNSQSQQGDKRGPQGATHVP